MKQKDFLEYQKDVTLRNLDQENQRLREEIKRVREEAVQSKNLLAFHDSLEKDFFSAESLEDLIMKLIHRLRLRRNVDFVTLCLTREYLEAMLGSHVLDRFLPRVEIPKGLGYLHIVDQKILAAHLGSSSGARIETTHGGSREVFFPVLGNEVRSHVIIPLFQRLHVIGSLNIGSFMAKHLYTAEMGSELLGRLSTKLAIAIDNILAHKKLALQKDLLDHDISRASILQKGLLPPSFLQTGRFRLWCRFHPCEMLGGDFYDVIPLQNERLGIVIADVSGHGITAALIAAMLKFSLQGIPIGEYAPVEVISELNRRFTGILQQGDYITLCFGILNPGDSEIDLVRAGHPYPILYRAEQGIPLKSSGPPLGLDPEAEYENLAVCLGPGDAVLFYTDGLTEILGKAGAAEEENEALLSLGKGRGTAALLEQLTTAMDTLEGAQEPEDDVSYVLLSMT